MNILFQKVEKVINEWDPINLLPLFPPDEYKKEITLIVKFIETSKNTNEVADYIHNVFAEHFGENIFDKSNDECLKIASLLFE